jgi:hypothetical protein
MKTFKIEAKKLSLEIGLVDIASLHLHEETIPEATEYLVGCLKRDGFLRDPPIVDKNTFVILDGMHRVTAAKAIGCDRMVVCLVDYENSSIRINTWYRAFKEMESHSLSDIIQSCGYDLYPIRIEEAEEQTEKRKGVGFFADSTNCFLIHDSDLNVYKSYKVISKIEGEAKRNGVDITYETSKDAITKLRRGELDVMIGPRKISKKDVRTYGLRDQPFPHKATRHTIPARPLGIDMPIELLKSRKDNLDKLNMEFLKYLYDRNLRRIPPGALIQDRRYEEEVFIFE